MPDVAEIERRLARIERMLEQLISRHHTDDCTIPGISPTAANLISMARSDRAGAIATAKRIAKKGHAK